jgi:predicted O-methyltransferase YrrM
MPPIRKAPRKGLGKWLLPARLRRAVKLRRARRALDRVAPRPCDASPLRPAREIDPAAIWGDAAAGAAWEEAAPRLEELTLMAPSGARTDANRGVNPGDRRAIFHLVRALRPKRVLEIGTNVGFSTLHIAAAMEPGSDITTVDIVDVNDSGEQPWAGSGDPPYAPRTALQAAGLSQMVRFVKADSVGFLEETAERFDFIFLDGSHDAAVVYREIPLALAALAPGGTILLHDYYPGHRRLWSNGVVIPGPCLAVERLRAEGAGLTVLPLGELPWTTKLDSRVTSLALLARDA